MFCKCHNGDNQEMVNRAVVLMFVSIRGAVVDILGWLRNVHWTQNEAPIAMMYVGFDA